MPEQSSRTNSRQAKADEEARIATETMHRRMEQRRNIEAATKSVENLITSVREKKKKCDRLASHLAGFYEEVDKLAKGKALLEATDLIVEHANNIIRESKALIQDDPYLDKIKEFVPAGNNPVYPDVLLVARAIQQAVERYGSELSHQEQALKPKLLEGRTILAALRFFTEKDGYVVTKRTVQTIIDNPPGQWFDGSCGSETFNYARLDSRNVVAYLLEDI